MGVAAVGAGLAALAGVEGLTTLPVIPQARFVLDVGWAWVVGAAAASELSIY